MDNKEKKRLRKQIGESLDLSSTRLRDWDYALFINLITDLKERIGESKSVATRERSFSSEGKFERITKDLYQIRDDGKLSIHKTGSWYDNDGSGDGDDYEKDITNPRDILEIFNNVFKKR